MSRPRLSRRLPGMPAAPPVRIVHLGLGNFLRAHQAWYTANAPDASGWGIAAFTGRRPGTATDLAPQDGLYTLIIRGAEGDRFEVLGAVAAVHPATDHDAYLDYLRRPEVVVVTVTVTEAGYLRGPGEDWLERPSSWVDGVRSIAVGMAGNESLRSGLPVTIADLGLGVDLSRTRS